MNVVSHAKIRLQQLEHEAEIRLQQLAGQGISAEHLGITREQLLYHLDPSGSNELRELWKQDKKRRESLRQFLPKFDDLQKGHNNKAPNGAAKPSDGENEPFFDGDAQRTDSQSPPEREIVPTRYVSLDPTKIPPRQWLYGKHHVRKFVAATFAPGGLGKTSLVLVEAIAMATGRPLLGAPVPKRLCVWYWNGEDPKEETDRRIATICLHYKSDQKELEGWLFTDTGRKTPICIAQRQKNDVIFTPDADALAEAIKANAIEVFILDPFVKTHAVPENDNGAIDRVARTFGEIADKGNCSVELTHHVRKASNFGRAEITVDDGRGAGSLKDASRSVRVMNGMAAEEETAAQVKPKDCKSYFRVDDNAKTNMAPPAESASWFKIVSVPLFDGPEDPNAFGDSVGVVTSWKLPGVFAGVQTGDLAQVQAKIDSGDWGKDPRSRDWAGYAIAAVLDLDATDEVQKTRITRLLQAWIDSKALKVQQKPSPTTRGRDRTAVVVGNRVEADEP